MTKKYDEMRKNMLASGFYTGADAEKDIEKIIELEKEFDELCEEIAEECEAEGYPSHGSNYELRCASAREYYDERISYINWKYEPYDEEEEWA